MKRRIGLFVLSCTVILSVAAQAQAPPVSTDDPASTALRHFYNIAKRNILRGAEKMPEESYAFKPTPEVRSFGELLMHIAEGEYLFCSSVKGEPGPYARGELEKSKMTKAEITAALNDAFNYCEPVFAGLTDAQLGDKVQFFGRETTKSRPLTLAVAHSWEHYGNMVTYLRLKGIVPPSSEQQAPPPPPATQEKPPTPPQPPAEPAPAKKEPGPPKPTAKPEPATAPKVPAGDVANGKAVYTRACQKCHAADGSGVAAIAKAMKVELRPLSSAEVQKISDAELASIIKNGKGKMVKTAGLTEKDVADVIAYVRSLKK
ncbi:MAG TPA: DinB family protein [Candidatus Xenobia bacterium]|nr:DinB family protein [Candidatus Xenobia bacterium]